MTDGADPRPPVPRVLFALVAPFRAFLRLEAASGILLFFASAASMALANSVWAGAWASILHAPLGIRVGHRDLYWPLHHLVNDGLMTLFFFVVGMEIKRELVRGELRTFSRAILPAVAAVGGMVVPALLHHAIAAGTPAQRGWGIPMATDIAFALGCMTLVKSRVPTSLFVFLTALAIFDDLGAIIVIAAFYGGAIHWGFLALAAGLGLLGFGLNRARVSSVWPYALVGAGLWFAMLRSGVHATLAGVVLGLMIPSAPPRDPRGVLDDLDEALDALRRATRAKAEPPSGVIAAIERHLESVQSPLDRTVHGLQGLVAFGVVPLFALANAGVSLGASRVSVTSPAALGPFVGLLVGKPLGVVLTTLAVVRLRVAEPLKNATTLQLVATGTLAGVGFTMSLFVDGLAYGARADLADAAKLGVLLASSLAALVGLALFRLGGKVEHDEESEGVSVVVDLPRFGQGWRVEPWPVSGPLVGKTLGEAGVRERHGVTVLGVWKGMDAVEGRRALEPAGPDYRFAEGDTALLVAQDEQLAAFRALNGEGTSGEGV